MKKTKFLSFFAILALTFASCSNVPPPEPPITDTGEKTLPYSENFSANFGAFTAVSVDGDQKWEIDTQYKYAIMTGYVDGSDLKNEDWLISPKIKMTASAKIKMSFSSVVRYTGNVKNEIFVMVSENYTGDVATATWTQLPIEFANSQNWTLKEVQCNMSDYAGKTITVAFKYVSTATKAGTWELNNFSMQEGEVDVPVIIGDDEKGGVNNPYTVEEVIALNPTSTSVAAVSGVYAVGTIIGVWDTQGKVIVSENIDATDANMTYNLILGTQEKHICVQLPGGEIRNEYNVAANPDKIGKTLKIKGDIMLYNSKPGLKNVENPSIVE